jgi:hypothetical protein
MHSRWRVSHCNFQFLYILWTDYSFKFCLDRLSLEGVCRITVLGRSETALLGTVGLLFSHVVNGC